ncbi:hypothetical protein SCORR_v1c04350 [Spiroplasma corruscae]|uniref:Lipoprotein n=1 Tax=Spiroplasma corruscae TaxID=216934 RepID=A0A222ENX2_9MOLU|nr:hypothetical protein [Spiroplasma corruscae]ASP28209.1 hypothetical protein SCORR_v1c04350 [Spiroplasma corruscae]
MKINKLMLFNSFLLFITPSVVVSCGENQLLKDPAIDNELQFNGLLKGYLEEINKLVNNWSSIYLNAESLIENDNNNDLNNRFFNASLLREYSKLGVIINSKTSSKVDLNSETFKNYLLNYNTDINRIINFEALKLEINKIKEKTKYKILFEGIDNVYNGIKYIDNSIYLKMYTSTNSNIITKDTINCEFNFKVLINYKDFKNKIQTKELNTNYNVSYIYTKDTAINDLVKNIVFNVEKTIKGDVKKIFSNDIETYNDKENKFYQLDLILKNYFEKKIKNNYINYITNIIKSYDNNAYYATVENSFESIYGNLNWIIELNANNNQLEFNWKDNSVGQKLYDFIFRMKENFKDFSIQGKNYLLEESINDYLLRNIINFKDDYKIQINKYIESQNSFDYKDFTTSSKVGVIELKNLCITNNDIKLSLPTLKSIFTYSVNNEEILEYDSKEKWMNSMYYLAIYKGLYLGIKDFQEFFGIYENIDTEDYTIASMKGSYHFGNILDYFIKSFDENDPTNWNNFNDCLSGSYGNLNQYRNNLLINQSQFLWRTENDINQVSLNLYDINYGKGFSIKEYYKNDTIPSGESNKYGESYINFLFQNDFLNIKFKTDRIWGLFKDKEGEYKDKLIFEINNKIIG